MKKLIILLLVPVSMLSQQKPWQKLKMDSLTFDVYYGTEQQYNYQHQLSEKSSSGLLNVYTGAQFMYMYNMALYLGEKYNVSFSPGDDIEITATPKMQNPMRPQKIKVLAKINNMQRVQSVTITGPADDLVEMFVRFWDLAPITINELKTKGQVVKEFVSDKVALSWPQGGQPVISITKNKNASLDLFPL